MTKRKPTQDAEGEGETFSRLVRAGLAKNAAEARDVTPVDTKPQGGAWFWYLVIAVMAFAAVYKTVGAP